MSFILIVGRPGGGKTYWAMSEYILPAVKKGRRVLHNIPGYKPDPAKCKVPPINFGKYPIFPWVNVDDNGDLDFQCKVREGGNPDAAVLPGDLVVVDEFYLVKQAADIACSSDPRGRAGKMDCLPEGFLASAQRAGAGETMFTQLMNAFIRGHRHYTGGGFACDVIMMTQSDNELPPSLRNCAEKTIVMKTHALAPGRLRALHFDGFQQQANAKGLWCIYQKTFKPAKHVYSQYSSYTFGVAREEHRGFSLLGYFRNSLIFLAIMLAVMSWAWPTAWGAFSAMWGGGASDSAAAAPVVAPAPRREERVLCPLVIDGQCWYYEREVF